MSAKPHRAIKQPGSKYFWIVVDRDGCEIGNGDGGLEKDQAVLMAASTDLIAYAECEEAMHQSLTDPSAREKLNKHGFDGRDVFGFLRRMRQSAIAKARGQS